MLSPEENERLTRVGPGTPCGELMRRYWIPIAPYAQLLEDPVRKVRVLGEDLVLYKNRQGYRTMYHKGFVLDDADRYGPAVPLIQELHRRIEAAQEAALRA